MIQLRQKLKIFAPVSFQIFAQICVFREYVFFELPPSIDNNNELSNATNAIFEHQIALNVFHCLCDTTCEINERHNQLFEHSKMDEKSDFERFCGNDLKQLKNETDPTKRVHLLRRINLQMYAEACKM